MPSRRTVDIDVLTSQADVDDLRAIREDMDHLAPNAHATVESAGSEAERITVVGWRRGAVRPLTVAAVRKSIDSAIADLEPDVRTILRIDRGPTSRMGNPSLWITFADGSRHRTAPNAGIAYAVEGYSKGDLVRLELNRREQIVNLGPAR